MNYSNKIFMDTSRAMLHILLKRRWFYILLSILLAISYYTVRKNNVALPLRNYITTFRVKYGDADSKLLNSKKRLHWEMLNPYSKNFAKKYFESTEIIRQAGAKINYTVNYKENGFDIYPIRPIEVRFTSPEIKHYDSWTMDIDLDSTGIHISKLRGTYQDEAIKVDTTIYVPYGQATDSPVGTIIAKNLKPESKIKSLKLIKVSEIAAQDKYDSKMMRVNTEGSNLIELFLLSDCSPEFAQDLFGAIGEAYKEYAHDYYVNELRTYLKRLAEAKEQLQSRKSPYLDSLAQDIKVNPKTIQKAIADIEELEEEARANALVLSQNEMLDVVDDNCIKDSNQMVNPRGYIKYIALLIAMLFPILLLMLECFLRGWVLSPWTLPEEWIKRNAIFTLPKANDQLEWDILRILLEQKHKGKEQETLLILLSSDQQTESKLQETLVQPLSKSLQASGKTTEYKRLSTIQEFKVLVQEKQANNYLFVELPSIFESSALVEAQQISKAEVFIQLQTATSSHKSINRFAEQCKPLGITPNIFWSNKI